MSVLAIRGGLCPVKMNGANPTGEPHFGEEWRSKMGHHVHLRVINGGSGVVLPPYYLYMYDGVLYLALEGAVQAVVACKRWATGNFPSGGPQTSLPIKGTMPTPVAQNGTTRLVLLI